MREGERTASPGETRREPFRAVRSRILAHQRTLFAAISICLLLGLGFESLPLPVKAQFTPLTSLLAILALPLVVLSSRGFRATPLLAIVGAFWGFAAVHSVVALGIEAVTGTVEANRLVAWERQLLALSAGCAVFFVLRSTLTVLDARRVGKLVAWSALPGMVLALVNVLWGAGGWTAAGRVVTAVRVLVVPRGLSSAMRAAGFCFEPAHFAFYLAVVVLPATLTLALANRGERPRVIVVLAAELIAFVWAFSITGYVVLGGMLLALAFGRSTRRAALVSLAATAATIAILALVFPDNYLPFQARWLWSALKQHDWSAFPPSAVVVIFGTLGPFARAFSSLNLLGYGLGGTATHLAAMVPATGQAIITAASWAGMPTLTTSLGRVFAETGLAGLVLFAGMWLVAFRTIGRLRRATTGDRAATVMLSAASLALVGLAVGHTIKFGSFALPYMWFWLAYVDSRFLISATEVEKV
jgi:hypothetical protein